MTIETLSPDEFARLALGFAGMCGFNLADLFADMERE